jgi:NADPH:quinone reductase-like Zn-dependent oxidoreductase
MLAAYVETPNFADPLAALIVGERLEPEIHAGWTHVTFEAASLNRHDVWTLQGVTQHPTLPLPMVLGCDGAGRLDDGTEVMLYPVIPAPGWCGVETHGDGWSVFSELHPGTMAEYVTAPVGSGLRPWPHHPTPTATPTRLTAALARCSSSSAEPPPPQASACVEMHRRLTRHAWLD